jgi:DNA (cytosine-5)-methyltransferase 1
MRFGSVCSGIEAASVAWHPLGWKAAWLSEIEPFPSAVLAHHYPDVPNLGDMTLLPERILSGEVEAPDVFCGGTPCQAFSVAGLRNSLDDARGNLSLVFVGIANAIDHVRSVRRDDPAIIFWENVPGVLSTKDNAFGCFLAGLAGEDNPLEPPGGKWTNSGYVLGPKRAVAWRLLDAQYFGVAQRRKRVFVVASARADFDPAAVLFEFDGVRRDTAPSREAGQSIAPCVTNGPPFSRTGNERVEAEAMVAQPVKTWPQEVAPALDTTLKKYMGLDNQHVNGGCGWFVPDCAPTLRVNRPGEGGMPGDAGQLIPVVANTLNCLQGIQAPDTFNYIVHGTQDPCVSDIAFAQGRNNGGENVLVHPISIHPHCIGRAPEAGPQGKEYLLDGSAYCMDSRGQPQAVVQPIPIDTMNMTPGHSSGGLGFGQPGDPSFTLTKGHSHAVAQPMAFDLAQITSAANRTRVSPELPASTISKGSDMHVANTMAVRRLTPVECERLQGFPDNYTNIPWRKKDESPDGPRYKALGNSWAVPNVRWIGKRIQEQINAA